jgi:hypothetical protein
MSIRWFGVLGVFCLFVVPGRVCLGRTADTADAARHVESAKKLAADNKFEEAAAEMKKALEIAPKNDLLLAMTSEYEHRAGLFSDGLAHARRAIELNGKVGAYYVLAAANAHGTQDLAAAREYLQTVLKKGAAEFGDGAVQAARRVEGLLVKKTYVLQWELDPRKGALEAGVYRLPLPRDDLPYQSVTWKVTGAKSYKVVKTGVDHLLHVTPQGTKPFQLQVEISIWPYSYKDKLAARKVEPTPKDVLPYLGSSLAINPGSPALKKVAAELKSNDPVRTVNDITAWLKKNIDYKLTAKTIDKADFKSVDEILERKYAECYGYSMLFTALCRAAGIPARQIWGYCMKLDGSGPASHNWVEVYIGGVGWVPVDPQAPETFGMLPNTHLRFLMPLGRTEKSTESIPQANLLYMCGDRIRYETRIEPLSGK